MLAPSGPLLWGAVVVGGLFGPVLATPGRARVSRVRAAAAGHARVVHAGAARAGALWSGALGFVCLHTAVVVAAVRALNVPAWRR
ncbi:hypothetical protein [Streptomyces brasiliensis]|uniref:hypothetical protein n=1 Tax=Streptomyces brasiliensis TaxID=1954 RepID=UPI001670DBD4|nr:hypothetical protein [Streptomyces brasiliensis]